MAWLAQDIYLNIVKIFDLNFIRIFNNLDIISSAKNIAVVVVWPVIVFPGRSIFRPVGAILLRFCN